MGKILTNPTSVNKHTTIHYTVSVKSKENLRVKYNLSLAILQKRLKLVTIISPLRSAFVSLH